MQDTWMKEVVGGFKMLTQDFYGNSKTIVVAGIIILAVTSTNRNLKIFGYQQTVDSFFFTFFLKQSLFMEISNNCFHVIIMSCSCIRLVCLWQKCGFASVLYYCIVPSVV